MPSYVPKLPLALLIGPQFAGLSGGLSCPHFEAKGADSTEEASSLGLRPDALALELGPDLESNKALLVDALRHFRCPAVVVTPHGDVAAATSALRNGAAEVVSAPFDLETLSSALKCVLAKKEAPSGGQERRTSLGPIIGSAPCMQELYKRILSVSASDATVFIQGPSGTGKELVATAIHRHSARTDGPFVAVNCGAIPPNLLESELFGHERGAFTGAVARHEGKFEQADGGTLFLDEVAELPLDLQVKLLRVLQDMTVSRVGGKEPVPVDVRIICATNRDVRELLSKGLFREDLFYRLNVVPIHAPPLSERRQDIPLLLNHFLSVFAEKYGKYFYDFSIGAMSRLCSYDWPGNVREMENVVERMVVLNDGALIEERFIPEEMLRPAQPAAVRPDRVAAGDLPLPSAPPLLRDSHPQAPGSNPAFPLMPISQAEAELIRGALDRSQGNVVQAARILQIGQATLYRKLKRHSISLQDFRPSRKTPL